MASEKSFSEDELVRLGSWTRSTGHENDCPLPSEAGKATMAIENSASGSLTGSGSKNQVPSVQESDKYEPPEYKDQVRNLEERPVPTAEGGASSSLSGSGNKNQVRSVQESENYELPEYKDQVRNLEERPVPTAEGFTSSSLSGSGSKNQVRSVQEFENYELPEYKDQVRNLEERPVPTVEGVAVSAHDNNIHDGSTVVADARVLEIETVPPAPPLRHLRPLHPLPPGGIDFKNTLGRPGNPTEHDRDDPGSSASQPEPSPTASSSDKQAGKKHKYASVTYAAVVLGVLLAIVVPVAVILPSNGSEQGPVNPAMAATLQPDLFAVAQAEDDLSMFVELVKMVDTYDTLGSRLIERLTNRSLTWTVMAPTNDAFAQLDQDLLAKYSTPRWSGHWECMASTMIPSLLFSDNMTDGLTIASRGKIGVEGQLDFGCLGGVYNFSRQTNESEIYFNLEQVLLTGAAAVYNGQVLQADLRASNGIIHKTDVVPAWPLLDSILQISLYEGLSQPGFTFTMFSTVKSLIEEAGLVELFNTTAMTAFAFLNSGFDALPPGTLDTVNKTELVLNHIVLGDPLIPYFLTRQRFIVTAAGNTYIVENSDTGFVRIGGLDVLPNQYSMASNGIGYIISGLLVPPIGE